MKNLIKTAFVMLIALNTKAQTWEQVKTCGHCGGEYPAQDTSQNFYVTGLFSGSVTFGTDVFTSKGGYDGCIAKYDSAGNYVWAKTFGAYNILNHNDMGQRVAVDNEQNVIIGGVVADSLVYYDNALLPDVHSGINAFIAKVNSTDGSLIWQHTLQSDQASDIVQDITTDDNGGIYVSYLFGHKLLINDTMLLTHQQIPIIIKYDKDGNLKWFKMFNAPYGLYSANMYSMKHKNGYLYSGGNFYGSLSIDGQSITSNSNSYPSGYIFKMDTSGILIKLKNIIKSDFGYLYNLDVSNQNEISFVGTGYNATYIDTFYFNVTGRDFVAGKLDSNLNTITARILPLNSNSYDKPADLVIKDSKTFISGYYTNGANVEGIALQGNGTIIYKLNDGLGVEWIKNTYVINPADYTKTVRSYLNFNKDKSKLIVTGYYRQDATFDNTVLTGSSDFYAVLSDLDNTAGVARLSSVVGNKIAIYPNPTQNGVFYITPPNKGVQMPAQVRVFNASGVQVAETPLKQTTQNYAIDISTLPKGEYVLKLSIGKTVYSGRVVYE